MRDSDVIFCHLTSTCSADLEGETPNVGIELNARMLDSDLTLESFLILSELGESASARMRLDPGTEVTTAFWKGDSTFAELLTDFLVFAFSFGTSTLLHLEIVIALLAFTTPVEEFKDTPDLPFTFEFLAFSFDFRLPFGAP